MPLVGHADTPRPKCGTRARSSCIIHPVSDLSTPAPSVGVGIKTPSAAVAALVANVIVAWVAWFVLPEPHGDTLNHSEFADWLWIVTASGAAWCLIGVGLLTRVETRRLGLAVLLGVMGSALVYAAGLVVVIVAAGS
jgi:hypothetical protein